MPRGLPKQGRSPGTATASASLPPPIHLRIQGTRTGPLAWPSLGFPLRQSPVGPSSLEHTLRPAGRSLLNPRHCQDRAQSSPSHVTPKTTGEEPGGKRSHGGAGSIPLARARAGAAMVEAEGLPATPRFFMRSHLLHIGYIPAETCPCLALAASPMRSPPLATWPSHILPFLAGAFPLLLHVALVGSLPPMWL